MLGVTASVLDPQFASSGSVSGEEVLYYGGFDTLPIHGSAGDFRRALGLPPAADGKRLLRTLSRGQLHSAGLEAALDLGRHTILTGEPWTALEPDARESLNERLTRMKSEGHVIVCSTRRPGGGSPHRRRRRPPESGHRRLAPPRRRAQVQFDRDAILELYRRGA